MTKSVIKVTFQYSDVSLKYEQSVTHKRETITIPRKHRIEQWMWKHVDRTKHDPYFSYWINMNVTLR